MIKTTFIVFILFMFSLGVSSQIRLVKIEAKYVARTISTIYSINCSLFDTSFKSIIRSKIITDSIVLAKIDRQILCAKYAKKDRNIDVRTKLRLYYSNGKKPLEICTNGYSLISIEGRIIKNKDGLSALINDLVQ